ncbi:retinoic acid-induced protein 1 [Clupea harengus]|uniref:Retinoic acid-induced protein 1 n=1 Tax=Clupea harengus TaxID=7950 RepID=A0A6P8FS11_CLUHA|nr:retinoic acid-induced protein 1 [Clupea harengus]
MQSFRERSGFHGNQHCYQQDSHEFSHLESYRPHHQQHPGQSRQGYETHPLSSTGIPPTRAPSTKDCYGQQGYPTYISAGGNSSTTGSAAEKKPSYHEGKVSGQHLQAGYGNHMGGQGGYSAQYLSEGHLQQQKWEDTAPQLAPYEQDMVGRLEPGGGGSGGGASQYLEQGILGISQSHCHLPSQPSAPVYTSSHQQSLAPSPLMYPQSHMHFPPQHAQPPPPASSSASSASSYMDKCAPMPHGYKGYSMPPGPQYSRQLGNHSGLKPSSYRPQNNYSYQPPLSRSGFEQQQQPVPLQGMAGSQEGMQKFQHFQHGQTQQGYCMPDIPVRSPEQYYQNCSPSSSHSPARSVGRSPSYSSTPSPLMPNPETFQYSQPPTPINPTATVSSSSSSTGALQDQGMLMPPHTHPSSGVNHQSQSYSGSMKDRFSEKLLSNPSLWSLNALTSQVESISNNVQQLLLSEALMANKKGSKRGNPKKGEEYRGQLRGLDDSCPDGQQHGTHMPEAYSTPKSLTAELHEGAYSGSTEDQLDRSYYYCNQSRGPLHGPSNPHMPLNAVSSCSMTLLESRSVTSFPDMQSTAPESNPNQDPRLHSVTPMEGDHNSSLQRMSDERSPMSIPAQSPMKQETNSPPDIKRLDSSLKENFEESAWMEKTADEEEHLKTKPTTELKFKGEVMEGGEKQEGWSEDEKSPSLFPKMCTDTSGQSDTYESEESVYQEIHNKSDPDDSDSANRSCGLLGENHQGNLDPEMKSETFKSEPSPIAETHPKALPSISRGDLAEDQYLPSQEENSETLHLSPCSKQNEAKLLAAEGRKQETLEGQQSVLTCQTTEVREEQTSQSSFAEVINNVGRPQEPPADYCSRAEQQGCQIAVNHQAEEAAVVAPDAAPQSSERRSSICNIAPQSHTSNLGFTALGEKATPPAQTRDHIDRSDAKVLEPDSPQLPGKSILHSAPSWANTPPSPQKGDEDMEPGISCPSAVTPSAKPEPVAPSANPRVFGRKPGRGRRRIMHSNIGIRRQLGVEGEGAPTPAQKPNMPSSKSTILSDHMGAFHQEDIGSQTPKHLTDSLPSRMCTRSFSAQGSPKTTSPPIKKKPGPKPGGGSAPKGQVGRPRGLASKMKLLKQVEEIQASIDQARAKRAVTGIGTQEDNPDPVTLEIASEIKSPVKDQKAMVLRSRKTPEKPDKDLVKEKETPLAPPKKLREMKKQKVLLQQMNEASDTNTPVFPQKENYQNEPSKQEEKISPSVKKQSTSQSLETVKRKRGVKADKAEAEQPSQLSQPLELQEQHDPKPLPNTTGVGIRGPKKKRGPHPKTAVSSPATKNELPVPDVSEVTSMPPQCPTKTKYLPPRKGRGLKYEANKITSTPASKKQPFNLPPEALPEDPASKAVQQVPEQKEEMPEESCTAVQEIQGPADGPTPRKKRRIWATVECKVEPEGGLDAASLIINTPRLAKQRAIKNNHEMHLKQRRKRRKGHHPPEGLTVVEPVVEPQAEPLKESQLETQVQVELLTEQQELPAPSALTPTPAPVTSSDQPPTELPPETSTEPPKPRRGRKPSLKKKEAKASGEPNSVPAKRGRKPGPKKKTEQSTAAAKPPAKVTIPSTETAPKLKTRCRKQSTPKVKQAQQKITLNLISAPMPPKPEMKCPFIPYVRVDSSMDPTTACAIVNRLDEEQRIERVSENSMGETKPLANTVAKAIPTSSMMLLGPLVHKNLTDRCLKCCLCGMPSNYRDLGDLCGPYYLPNNIPRKTVSWGYREEFWESRRVPFISTQPPPVEESEKTTSQAGTSGEHSGHHRKLRRPSREGTHLRTNFRLRLKKLQQCLGFRRRAGETAPPGGEEGPDTALERMQREAEETEHWAHEACVVWTSGVVLVAGRLYGLKEAVQTAAQTKCAKCQSEGASVSCSCEGCSPKYHYVCAKESGCSFEEDNFSMRCPKHEAE